MKDDSLTRRRYLTIAGVTSLATLAGCTGSTGGGEPTSDPTATAAPEETHEDEAHGDDGDHHEPTEHGHGESIGEMTDHATVEMLSSDDGEHFHPHVVHVEVGGAVTWENVSGTHSTTAYHPDNDRPQLVPDGAASWDSGILVEEGETFEHTFETEGVYHYYCTPHESLGMIGSVIVGEPDAHDQPALEEPPGSMSETVHEKIVYLNEMINEALGHEH